MTAFKILIIMTALSIFVGKVTATSIQVGGTIEAGADSVWDVDTVNVIDTLSVARNAKLTISAGTKVIFQGYNLLNISGSLKAIGTEQDSIIFTAIDTSVGYPSIKFSTNFEECQLSFCSISYAKGDLSGGITTGLFCKLSISNSTFYSNKSNALGGGLFYGGGDVIIKNSQFKLNTALRGGGIAFSSTEGTIFVENSTFENNSATFGGGVYSGSVSEPIFISSLIQNNNATSGGGVYAVDANPIFINSLIALNTANDGAGVFLSKTRSKIINTTIVKNSASNHGGGVHFTANDQSLITNSLSTLNSATINGPNVYYSLNGGGKPVITNSDLNAAASLVDPDNGNYGLAEASKFINAGVEDTTGLGLPALDLNGNPRIKSTRVDVGAYEYQGDVSISFRLRQNQGKWTVRKVGNEIIFVFSKGALEGKISVYTISGEKFTDLEYLEGRRWGLDVSQLTTIPKSGIYLIKHETGSQKIISTKIYLSF